MKENEYYRIERSVREMLIFAPQNALKDPPFMRLDLVSCRNFLIYLDADLQKKILAIFHYSLKPDGILLLGPSETIGEYAEFFAPIDSKWKIFRRKPSAVIGHPLLEMPTMAGTPKRQRGEEDKPDASTVFQWVKETLLEKYAPSCVLINKSGEILYIHGRTGKFLEPSPGKISMNVLDMAREGLQAHLIWRSARPPRATRSPYSAASASRRTGTRFS